jgi:hypothetical protein
MQVQCLQAILLFFSVNIPYFAYIFSIYKELSTKSPPFNFYAQNSVKKQGCLGLPANVPRCPSPLTLTLTLSPKWPSPSPILKHCTCTLHPTYVYNLDAIVAY